MNIVENEHGKFDIDTVEGTEKYLESEGVNVAEYLQKSIEELKRHNKVLNSNEAATRHEGEVLNIPRVVWRSGQFCPNCYSKNVIAWGESADKCQDCELTWDV